MSANTNADVAAMVERLEQLRVILKSGDYDGADLMRAWCAMMDAVALLQSQQAELEMALRIEGQALAENRRLKAEITRLSAMVEEKDAALRDVEQTLTCGKESACYCPNCDTSFYRVREVARQALTTEQGR